MHRVRSLTTGTVAGYRQARHGGIEPSLPTRRVVVPGDVGAIYIVSGYLTRVFAAAIADTSPSTRIGERVSAGADRAADGMPLFWV